MNSKPEQNRDKPSGTRQQIVKSLVLFCFLIQIQAMLKAQDEHAIKVTTLRNLNFGTIIVGNNGGTVTIHPDGTRSGSGDVFLSASGSPGQAALFELKSPPRRLISLLLGKTTLAKGSHIMKLDLGPTDPISPFLTIQHEGNINYIHVGGTLFVGNPQQNPEGIYTGSFTITFFYE